MYLAEYDDPQLGGFFKKIRKAVKKIGRPIEKVVKKVAKPALHIGAAIATGGQSLSISAGMLAQQRARKEAQAQANQIAQALQPTVAPAVAAPTYLPAPVPMVATPAAPVARVTSIAPTATAVSQAQLPAVYQAPPVSRSLDAEARPRRRATSASAAPGGLPSWAIPAGIGAVALVGVLAVASRGKS